MNILLCNDDGINAPGLKALAKELVKIGKLTIVAPDSEKSAASNSITLYQPLRAREVDFFDSVEAAYAVSGTPSDCGKIALASLLPQKPDLVMSGINRGPNMCIDVFYSGTVAAAFEGANKDILSIAMSLNSFSHDADYSTAAQWAIKSFELLTDIKAPKNLLYNVNVPALSADKIAGYKWTKMGKVDYQEKFDKRIDPAGRPYYWLMDDLRIIDNDKDCDIIAVRDGYVSITPLSLDLSALNMIRDLTK